MKTRQAVIKYAEEEYAINIKHKEQPYTIKTDSKQNNKKKQNKTLENITDIRYQYKSEVRYVSSHITYNTK